MAVTNTGPLRAPDTFVSSGRVGGSVMGRGLRLGSIALAAALLLASCAAVTPQDNHASCMDLMLGHAVTPGAIAHGHGSHGSGSSLQPLSTSSPEPSGPPPTPTRNWSNAAGWPGRQLPVAGDVVTIRADEVVLLDVNPPALAGLNIEGSLVFAPQDLELTSDWIFVTGGMYVGSAQQSFTHRAVINLTGERKADSGCLGNKYLGLLHGTLEVYGDPEGSSWTRLSQTANGGAASIVVDDASGFRVGDRIVVASTDYFARQTRGDVAVDRQTEERTVAWVTGNTIGLDTPLGYMHFGQAQTFGQGTSGFNNTVLQSRAEVARLSRNVTIRSEAATTDPNSDRYRFGGHIMALGDSRIRLDSVEITNFGQVGVLLRYPVHFHLMGDAGAGSFVRNSSLHNLFNRCITVHGTNSVLLRGNAAYDTFGHCYFLEDGAERGNLFDGNLGIMARKPPEGAALLGSDSTFLGPSIFWITNPSNDFIGNVAASSEGSGFWFGLPEHPTGPSYAIFDGANTWPRRTPLGTFRDNLAHSNSADGLHVDRGPTADVTGVETTSYRPRSNPADPSSTPVTAVFQGFSAYRHRNNAVWTRGDNTVLRDALLVDNAIGATFASNKTWIERSIVVGESANLGHVFNWEEAGIDGRSLPKPWNSSYAIRGFEFYDGDVWADGVHFQNFVPNAIRQASGIGVLDFTSFSLSPRNHLQNVSFGPETNEVYLSKRTADQQSPATTDSNEDGYRSAVFQDRDGSLTGTAGLWVTVDNPLLTHAACSFSAAWNSHLCEGRYAALSLRDQTSRTARIEPVTIRRAANPGSGPSHTMFGTPNGGPSTPNRHFRTLLPLLDGGRYHYQFSGVAPEHLTVELSSVVPGDSLIVSLPWEPTGIHIYRDWWVDERNRLGPTGSLNGLLTMSEGVAYYYDEGAARLWLRLEVREDRDYSHLTICAKRLC